MLFVWHVICLGSVPRYGSDSEEHRSNSYLLPPPAGPRTRSNHRSRGARHPARDSIRRPYHNDLGRLRHRTMIRFRRPRTSSRNPTVQIRAVPSQRQVLPMSRNGKKGPRPAFWGRRSREGLGVPGPGEAPGSSRSCFSFQRAQGIGRGLTPLPSLDTGCRRIVGRGRIFPRQGGHRPRRVPGSPPHGVHRPRDVRCSPRKGGEPPRDVRWSPREGDGCPRDVRHRPRDGDDSPRHGGIPPREGSDAPRGGRDRPPEGSDSPGGGSGCPREGDDRRRGGRGSPREGSGCPCRGCGSPRGGRGSPSGGNRSPLKGRGCRTYRNHSALKQAFL